jgi:1-aminocyclopropane-1-carboxylate deaminase/D-cysteine desulfhydrase-like pyridoxal-dependent ACC family enzyme
VTGSVLDVIRGLPRIKLGHFPTPLEEAKELSRALGVKVLVKREDLSGLACGGNKVRKLEFVLAQAAAREADVWITVGAGQSNHARETAAAAARLGKKAILVLTADPPRGEPTGNQLLYRLLGAELVHVGSRPSDDPVVVAAVEEACRRAAEQGLAPHAVPPGGATWAGAAAWALGMEEALEQAAAMNARPQLAVVAAGTGSTAAGLALGSAGSGAHVPILGMSISQDATRLRALTGSLLDETAERLGSSALGRAAKELLLLDDQNRGEGYGLPTAAGRRALKLLATAGAVIGDLTYTSKAFAGIPRVIAERTLGPDACVLFVHTGGQPELFARDSSEVLD